MKRVTRTLLGLDASYTKGIRKRGLKKICTSEKKKGYIHNLNIGTGLSTATTCILSDGLILREQTGLARVCQP